MRSHFRFAATTKFLMLNFFGLLSVVSGQEQQLPESPGFPQASCPNDSCNYYYDPIENAYVITKPCLTGGCFCPIEAVTTPLDPPPPQGLTEVKTASCFTQPQLRAENEVRILLRHSGGNENLKLILKPDNWPNNEINIKVNSRAAKVVWDIKIVHDSQRRFAESKIECLRISRKPVIGNSSVYWDASSISEVLHFDEPNGQTCSFELKKLYRVEITRIN